uniref:Glycerol uptake facilitator protein n=1 Tax=Lygus hesperus TaxID=30085 RepID=A0A0A9YCE3_LYGHE
MVGAACCYALFHDHFIAAEATLKPGETMASKYSGLFCTYPNISNKYAVWSEFICTLCLLLVIMGINDERMTPATQHKPIAIGILVFLIGLCPGWCTGYAMNPARDFGPRLVTVFLWGSEPLTLNDHYFVVPLLVPFLGAFAGVLLYVLTVVSKVKV